MLTLNQNTLALVVVFKNTFNQRCVSCTLTGFIVYSTQAMQPYKVVLNWLRNIGCSLADYGFLIKKNIYIYENNARDCNENKCLFKKTQRIGDKARPVSIPNKTHH